MEPATLWCLCHREAESGARVSSLWQPEAERKEVELANVGVGVSASLSGPQLEVGDGGGREKEKEGWKRMSEAESRTSLASAVLFGFAQVLCAVTCDEMLSLLVFCLTLARAPFSPDDLSDTSRAALSSLGVSGLMAAAGA